MPILNYTTKVDSYKTISEIQQVLSKNGVKKIVVDNNSDNLPCALTFCIDWKGKQIAFLLPCNFEGVKKSMERNKKVVKSLCTEEQALRVGWRILKTWIEAQMAIVEAEVVELPEVFLAYAITNNGETLYNNISSGNMKLLH